MGHHRGNRVRRTLTALAAAWGLTVAAATSVAGAADASPTPGVSSCLFDRCVTTNGDGWVYDASTGLFTQLATSAIGTYRGHPVEEFYQPACVPDQTFGVDALCAAALHSCPLPGYLHMYVFTRPLGSVAAPQRTGDACIAPPRVVALSSVVSSLRTLLYQRILTTPAPAIACAPISPLVSLPAVIWTGAQPQLTLAVSVPVPGQLSAGAADRWSFGDGQARSGPELTGNPLRPGIYPNTSPTAYTLTHTWLRPGRVAITVDVSWVGTFTFAGLAFPIGTIVRGDVRGVTVRQAPAVLVTAPLR